MPFPVNNLPIISLACLLFCEKMLPFEEVDATSLQYQASICTSVGNDHFRLFAPCQRYVYSKDMWRLGLRLVIILVVCWLEERLICMRWICLACRVRVEKS